MEQREAIQSLLEASEAIYEQISKEEIDHEELLATVERLGDTHPEAILFLSMRLTVHGGTEGLKLELEEQIPKIREHIAEMEEECSSDASAED
jgi:hypothetical protein